MFIESLWLAVAEAIGKGRLTRRRTLCSVNELPTFEDVQAAARRIEPFVHRTPVMTSATLDRTVGARVFFKCENLQKVGAFKARGAVNAVLSLDDDTAARGVVTHSSGN